MNCRNMMIQVAFKFKRLITKVALEGLLCFTGTPLEIKIEGCKTSNLYKSVGRLREILEIEGCNIGLVQKSRGAIEPLSPLYRRL